MGLMKHLLTLSVLSALSLLSAPVLAGISGVGSVAYGPVSATPIPTLSGTMLIVLSLLMATLGYRIMRQKDNDGRRMMVLSLVGVGALTFAASGVKLINDAQAAYASTTHSLGPATSGSAVINDYDLNMYMNNTAINLQIKNIVIDPGKCTIAQAPDPVTPECAAGVTILAAGEKCRVACISPPPP